MQIKVQGLVNGAAWVLETHGSAVLSEILALCGPDVRERYITGIAIEWHDATEFEEFLTAAEKCLHGPPGSIAREIGAAGARRSLTGPIHRFAFYAARQDYAFARVAAAWRRFNDAGEMTLERIGDAGYSVRVTGAKLPGPLFCATLTGWTSIIADLLDMKNAKVVHSQCCSRGDKTCVWTLSWEL